MAEHVYHWKHGWIPLTHAAALSKTKGNREAADKMVAAAHDPSAGIHSRQHVATAALQVTHLAEADRPAAMKKVQEAAKKLDATDLLPHMSTTMRRVVNGQEQTVDISAELKRFAHLTDGQLDEIASGSRKFNGRTTTAAERTAARRLLNSRRKAA